MTIPFSAGKQTMHISIEYYNLYARKCIQRRFFGHKTTKNSYKIQTIHFDDWTYRFAEYWSKFKFYQISNTISSCFWIKAISNLWLELYNICHFHIVKIFLITIVNSMCSDPWVSFDYSFWLISSTIIDISSKW